MKSVFNRMERIRDIIKVNDNKIVMFLENTPSLAILETR